jgi:putative aldouronate transport system substrate-binding protein
MLFGCTDDAGKTDKTEQVATESANFNASGYPIVKEPISLTLMGPHNPGEGDFQNLVLFKEMEKLTNIKLSYNLIPKQGYDERRNLAFASGDLPDFFYRGGITPIETELYGSQGILIPLEGLIDKYATNIKRVLKENPDIASSITSTTGHIYTLPSINLQPRSKYSGNLMMQKQMLDQTKMSVPKNTDQLYELLKELKKLGKIPLSGTNLDTLSIPMMAAFGVMQKDWVQTVGDKVVFVPTQESYKQYLIYMNKLWNEGLIDPQILTHTQQEFIAKGQSDKLGVISGLESHVIFKITQADVEAKTAYLPPLVSPSNKKAIYPQKSAVNKGVFAITSKDRYPAETIRWVDFFWSARGALLQQQGILLSEDFMKDPSKVYIGGSTISEEDLKKANMSRQQFNNTYFTVFGGSAVVSDKEFDAKLQQQPNVAWTNHIAKTLFDPVSRPAYPDLNFSVDEINKLQVLSNDITSYVDEMHAKMVTGNYSIQNWDAYVKSFGKMKVDEYVSIYQKAYDRWKALNKK